MSAVKGPRQDLHFYSEMGQIRASLYKGALGEHEADDVAICTHYDNVLRNDS